MTRERALLLTGVGGLGGALLLFVGDMLFYGRLAGGAGVHAELATVVRSAPLERLMLGGLLAPLAGLGYLAGAVHVYLRAETSPKLLRRAILGGMVGVSVIAASTHSVWGAFAVALRTSEDLATDYVVDPVARYLEAFFVIGQLIGFPTAALLLVAVATGRTSLPRWTAVLNPGGLYLLFVTGTYLPAPFGWAVVGGAFNLAFAVFFLAALCTLRPAPATVAKTRQPL